MPDTKTALEQGQNPTLAFVLAIEGYPYLITSWSDAAAVVTAWAGKDWSAARRGLSPPSEIVQDITPLASKFDDQIVSVTISNEQVGKDLFNLRSTGARVFSTANVSPTQDKVRVTDTSSFSSSGTIYIGNEHCTYTGKTDTYLTGLTRGMYSPFSTYEDNGRWARSHRASSYGQNSVIYPIVSDYRRSFHGAWAGIWVHKVTGGVLDTLDDAELLFAGKLEYIADDATGAGATIVSFQSLLGVLNNQIIGKEQLTGLVRGGVYLRSGGFLAGQGSPPNYLPMQAQLQDTLTIVSGDYSRESTVWRVVVSGATQPYEINEGWYTIEDIYNHLNTWLTWELGQSNLYGSWGFSKVWNEGSYGPRTKLEGTFENLAGVLKREVVVQLDRAIALLFGFSAEEVESNNMVLITGESSSAKIIINSANAPLLALPQNNKALRLKSVQGSYYNTSTRWLPSPWRAGPGWSYLLVGDSAAYVAKRVDSLNFADVNPAVRLARKGIAEAAEDIGEAIEVDSDQELTVKQLFVLEGSLKELFTAIFASTGTPGYNHPTYDTLGYQLGIEIPWTLLGSNFTNSISRLASASTVDGLCMVLEKPTALRDVVIGEFGVRDAHLIFKSGHLQVVVPTIPPTTAGRGNTGFFFNTSKVYNLTTSNKASDINNPDRNLSAGEYSITYLTNQIKLKYGRDITDKYHHTIEVSNQASISDLGIANSIEIAARNIYGTPGQAHEYAEGLIADLAARTLSQFAWPLITVTRTYAYPLYDLAPGDYVRLTDDFVRNPNTGERGLTNYMGWVKSTSFDWKSTIGQVEIILTNKDATGAAFSPVGLVDEAREDGGFIGGYNPITKELQLGQEFLPPDSLSVVAEGFEVGDSVKLLGILVDSADSPSEINTTIEAVDITNNIVTVAAEDTKNLSWTTVVNCTTSGTTLTKSAGGSAWNAGAVSAESISAKNGYVKITLNDDFGIGTRVMGGLSNGDTDQDFDDIDFCFGFINNTLYIYEGGVLKQTLSSVAAGDTFEIWYIEGDIKYCRDGVVLYTSLTSPTTPLLVDTSIYYEGDSIIADLYESTWEDNTSSWHLLSQNYAEAATTQRENAYISASGTNFLAEDSEYNTYSLSPVTASGVTSVSGTDLVEYIPTTALTSSGVAYTPLLPRQMSVISNNLTNYKACGNQGFMEKPDNWSPKKGAGDPGTLAWKMQYFNPIYIGNYLPPPGKQRKLFVAPSFGRGTADEGYYAKCRITLTNRMPGPDPTTSGSVQHDVTFSEPYNQVTWTETEVGSKLATVSGIPLTGSGPTIYMAVELTSDNVAYDINCGGVPICYLGPLEDVD